MVGCYSISAATVLVLSGGTGTVILIMQQLNAVSSGPHRFCIAEATRLGQSPTRPTLINLINIIGFSPPRSVTCKYFLAPEIQRREMKLCEIDLSEKREVYEPVTVSIDRELPVVVDSQLRGVVINTEI